MEWCLLWLPSESFSREEVNTNPFRYQVITLDWTTLLTPGGRGIEAGARLGSYFSSSSSPLDISDLCSHGGVLAWLRLPC